MNSEHRDLTPGYLKRPIRIPLAATIEFLRQKLRQLDPKSTGVNIVLNDPRRAATPDRSAEINHSQTFTDVHRFTVAPRNVPFQKRRNGAMTPKRV